MNETLALSEIQRLRSELSQADSDVLLRLVSSICQIDPGELTDGDVELFTKFEPWLRVGSIPLPDGADTRLKELLARFAGRWMSQRTLDEFETACNELTASARQRSADAEEMRVEIVRLTKLNETLAGYLRLLDTLQPVP